MKLFRRALVVSLVMTLTAAGLAVQPATAEVDAGIDSVTEVEEAIEEVLDSTPVDELVEETAADVSDLMIDEDASDVVVELETDDGASVEIPAEADEAIVIENAEGDELEIGLPGNGDDAEVTDDGSVVYEDALPDTDMVVQAQDDGGIRILTVFDGPDAASSYDFEVSGLHKLLCGGDIVTTDGEGNQTGYIPAPWAYDANGVEVPSWYTVDGGTITLHVDHSEVTAYPVVADPWWSRLLYAGATNSLTVLVCVPLGIGTANPFVGAACGVGMTAMWATLPQP